MSEAKRVDPKSVELKLVPFVGANRPAMLTLLAVWPRDGRHAFKGYSDGNFYFRITGKRNLLPIPMPPAALEVVAANK
jgi:hypothetical protein